MRITLEREKIYESVSMRVSVIGRDIVDANGNSVYDRIRIQERDYPMLDSYRDTAVSEVILALRDFVISKSSGEIDLYLDDRINPSLIDDANTLILEYIVNRICCEWMKIKWEASAENFQNRADLALTTLSGLFYYRNSTFESTVDGRYHYSLEDKKTGRYKISLLTGAILNDIEKELFNLYKTRKNVADAIQPGSIEIRSVLNTYINRYAKKITERISAYLLGYKRIENNECVIGPQIEYQYSMDLPCSWPSHKMEQLVEEMHAYVVDSCLFDFLKGNFPNESLIYKGLSEDAWDAIKHCISSRERGLKKPLQPF